MPKYMMKVSYSTEGIKGLLAGGGSAREAAIEKLLAGVGGSLESLLLRVRDRRHLHHRRRPQPGRCHRDRGHRGRLRRGQQLRDRRTADTGRDGRGPAPSPSTTRHPVADPPPIAVGRGPARYRPRPSIRLRPGSVRWTCRPFGVSRIRPRIPVAASSAAAPRSSAGRDQDQLLGTGVRRERAQPRSSWLPMPIRRQAGATSSVPSAGRAGKSWVNSADPITPVPTRARTPLVASSYATTASRCGRGVTGAPIAAAMSFRAAARTCSVGERLTRGPSRAVSSAWTPRRVVDEPSYRRQPLGGLVLELLLRADGHGDLRAARRLDELDQPARRHGLGHLDDQVIGDRAQVGVDLQGEDVDPGSRPGTGPARRGRQGCRAVGCGS